MKKTFFTLLGLIGIMGTLSIGVVSADTSCWNGLGTVPTSTYASGIVYGCDENIPIISINDVEGKGITIKAMNEGTGIVKIGSLNDTSSYGVLYQWGNNYPFPNVSQNTSITSSDSDVSAIGYGPNTTSGYYYRAIWIKQQAWDYSDIRNLWGGGGDEINDGTLNGMRGYNTGIFEVTNSGARQAMCPDGYHIPSDGEWNALLYLWTQNLSEASATNLNSLSNKSEIDIGNKLSHDMLLPFIGGRNKDANPIDETYGYYWSSSPGYYKNHAYNFYLSANDVGANDFSHRGAGEPIRCFKNSYVKSPKTLNLYFMTGMDAIQEIGSGIVTENMTGSVPADVTTTMNSVVNTGYIFANSWSLSGETTAFDFENTPISGDWADARGNVYFFAQWTPITYTISFSGNSENATGIAPTTINAEYDSGDISPDNSFTRAGYTFTGWNTESDGTGTGYTVGAEIKNLTITSGADVVLYAQWVANIHKLSFVVDGTTIQSGDVAYDTAISAPADPKKDCNSFAGWTSSVEGLTTTGTMPDSDVTFTATWNYTCSRSSGGGGSSRSSTSNDSVKSTDSQTGSQVDTPTNVSDSEENTQDSSLKASEGQNQGKTYSEEFQKAYEFAYKHGITTMPTIEEANMEAPLTRIAMAKMLSYYAINILGQKPANIVVPKFNDVSDELDAQYDNGVALAYQLGIMGINMQNNRFRPNDLVTRGEFATALSRMLYGIADGNDKYYSTHLAKLMEEKIITNDDPKMKGLRGYVMIMLMRSAENKSTEN